MAAILGARVYILPGQVKKAERFLPKFPAGEGTTGQCSDQKTKYPCVCLMSDFDKKKYLGYLWLLSDEVLEDVQARALKSPGSDLLAAVTAELEFRKERHRKIMDSLKSSDNPVPASTPSLPDNLPPTAPPDTPSNLHDQADKPVS